MLPSLGQKYPLEVEWISKPPGAYQTDEYFELDLPVAPAIMVEEEIIIEGSDVPETALEAAIRQRLGLPELEAPKGFFRRLFGR